MMQAEIRKERIKKYGSFLYCPKRNTLCFGIDTPKGVCKYKSCLLDDPAYIAKQAEIDRKIQENARRERQERKREKENREKQIIRRQTKTRKDLLEQEIRNKERQVKLLYRDNKPKAADIVMNQVIRLNAKLREME